MTSIYGNYDSKILLENSKKALYFGGKSKLIVYAGHNGLMEHRLKPRDFKKSSFDPVYSYDAPLMKKQFSLSERQGMVFACLTMWRFKPFFRESGAFPLIWTRNTMAPEGYVLTHAIEQWLQNSDPKEIKKKTVWAYVKFNRSSKKYSENLFMAGWEE